MSLFISVCYANCLLSVTGLPLPSLHPHAPKIALLNPTLIKSETAQRSTPLSQILKKYLCCCIATGKPLITLDDELPASTTNYDTDSDDYYYFINQESPEALKYMR